jgi:hypothetical protein
MSSKRKSPPTKVLDGSNNNGNILESKILLQENEVMPATEIDLSIKSSSPRSTDIDTYNNVDHRGGSSSPTEKFDTRSEINHHQQHHNQMNGDKMSGNNNKRRGGDIQVRRNLSTFIENFH